MRRRKVNIIIDEDNNRYPNDLSVLSLDCQMQGRLQIDILQIELGSAGADK